MDAELIDVRDKSSWGYLTLKKRLPQYVEDVIRDGAGHLSEQAIANLRKLKAEIESAGVIQPIQASSDEELRACEDVDDWRDYMKEHEGKRWDELPFYWLEAYYYRRLLQESHYFVNRYDPFSRTKLDGIAESLHVMKSIAFALLDVLHRADEEAGQGVEEEAVELFLLRSLWGNKADLSLFSVSEDPLALVHQKLSGQGQGQGQATDELQYLIVDESPQVLRHLLQLKGSAGGTARVDIILDNSGLELFSDLCFAHSLTALLGVDVHLHTKRDPMFVSDAMPKDVYQLIEALEAEAQAKPEAPRAADLARLARQWRDFLEAGRWRLRPHKFWNSALFFDQLAARSPELEADLRAGGCRVAFVKGDANYRRLVGDRRYAHTTPFAALAGHFPVPVVALRVLKSEVVVGLADGQDEAVARRDEQWLVDGKWATIQFAATSSSNN